MQPEEQYRCDVCGTPLQGRTLFCRRCGTPATGPSLLRRGPLQALAAPLLLAGGFLTGILLPVQSGLFPFVVFGLVLLSGALPVLKRPGASPGTGRQRLLQALDGIRIRPMVLPPSVRHHR